MKKIVHIICRDKFTAGYINFMNISMKKYCHIFITTGERNSLSVEDLSNVIVVNSYRNLTDDNTIKRFLSDSDKIVVSGVFGIPKYLLRLSDSILKKVSLHFWGGDFYEFRNLCFAFKKSEFRKIISKWQLKRVIQKCDSLLFLVPDDYEQYLNIINLPKKNFVVPMPTDPIESDDYTKYLVEQRICRILVGNSATPENHHKEAFDIIKNIDAHIEVMCPLSYGDKCYSKEIKEYGKKIFGEKFIPLTSFYEKEEYIKRLTTCSVGIFNNDRQQALGNIYIMLALGKKVFIRKDTSMWGYFQELGVVVYDVNTIKMLSVDEMFFMHEEDRCRNTGVLKKIKENDLLKWTNFLDAN